MAVPFHSLIELEQHSHHTTASLVLLCLVKLSTSGLPAADAVQRRPSFSCASELVPASSTPGRQSSTRASKQQHRQWLPALEPLPRSPLCFLHSRSDILVILTSSLLCNKVLLSPFNILANLFVHVPLVYHCIFKSHTRFIKTAPLLHHRVLIKNLLKEETSCASPRASADFRHDL